MKLPFKIEDANTLVLSAEKIMYGVVFLKLTGFETGIEVNYAAIADGGLVCGEGCDRFEDVSIKQVFECLSETDMPEQEDDEASYSWGIQIGSKNQELIAEIENGYWDGSVLTNVLDFIESALGVSEAVEAMKNLAEF